MTRFSIPGLDDPVKTDLTGFDQINQPLLNKGTAFTMANAMRFGCTVCCRLHLGTLDEQMSRRLNVLRSFETDFERYAFLHDLQDFNETLFYALPVRHTEELLPLDLYADCWRGLSYRSAPPNVAIAWLRSESGW